MAIIEERKSKNGEVTYRVKIRIKDQKPVSRTFERKHDAKVWMVETEAALRKRRNFPLSEGADKTVSDLIDAYIKIEVPKLGRMSERVPTYLKWWRAEIGHIKLAQLRPGKLAECRDKLLSSAPTKTLKRRPGTGLNSSATVVWYMNALSMALSIAAKQWEWIDSNPMLKVEKPKLPQLRVRYLSPDEIKALLNAAKQSSYPELRTIIALALSTAGRKSEILNLRWRDVDIKLERVTFEHTKNGERRSVALKFHALDLLRDLKDRRGKSISPEERVFEQTGKWHQRTFDAYWHEALDKAGIKNFRFHDLRHTAASYAAMDGATLLELAEMLGHKTLSMVRRYAHLSEAHSATVVDKMNRTMLGGVEL